MRKRRSQEACAFHLVQGETTNVQNGMMINSSTTCYNIVRGIVKGVLLEIQNSERYQKLVEGTFTMANAFIQESIFMPKLNCIPLKQDLASSAALANIPLAPTAILLPLVSCSRPKKIMQSVNERPYKSIALPNIVSQVVEDELEEQIQMIRKRKVNRNSGMKNQKKQSIFSVRNDNLQNIKKDNQNYIGKSIQYDRKQKNKNQKGIKNNLAVQTQKNDLLKKQPILQKLMYSRSFQYEENRLPYMEENLKQILLRKLKQKKGVKIRQTSSKQCNFQIKRA